MRPRFFATSLDPRGRRVYRGVTLLFLGVFFALIWPVYPLFSGDRPRILGVPHSLAYVVALLLVAFLALLWLYTWEDRRGALGTGAEGEPRTARDAPLDADERPDPGNPAARPPA